MRASNSVIDVLAGVAVVVFGYYGTVVISDVIVSGFEMLRFRGGGTGAVSFGVTEGLLLWLPSVLVNRLLAGPAGRLGGLLRKLYRAHLLTIVASVVLLVVAAATLILNLVSVPTSAVVAGFLLLGSLVGLQFLLLAGALLAFVWRRHSGARFAMQD